MSALLVLACWPVSAAYLLSFVHDAEGRRVDVIAGYHHGGAGDVSSTRALHDAIDTAGLVLFEGIDSVFAASRRNAYAARAGELVFAANLDDYGRLCATALRLAFRPPAELDVDAAPVVYRLFLMEASLGRGLRDSLRTADGTSPSLDALLRRRAASGAPFAVLESTDDLIDAAAAAPPAVVKRSFDVACRRSQDPTVRSAFREQLLQAMRAEGRREWDSSHAHYRQALTQTLGIDAAVFDALLDRRSAAMVDATMRYAASWPRLVMVIGLQHLGGPQGVRQLLLQRGYRQIDTPMPGRQ